MLPIKREKKRDYKEVKNPFYRRDISSPLICECNKVDEDTVRLAIKRGAKTLDGIKLRTHAAAGECAGTKCVHKILHILSKEKGMPLSSLTKKGRGSSLFIQ
jgi:glycerol-3-phosphate dehydrogenase